MAHAWGDSNLYLRRDGERLLMSIEHRASASSGGIELTRGERGGGLSLHLREDRPQPEAPQPATPAALTRRELRDTCRLRKPP